MNINFPKKVFNQSSKTLLIAISVLLSGMQSIVAAPPLPVRSTVWVSEGNVRVPVITNNGLDMTIEQLSDRAILQWESFDIGQANSVYFDQPSRSSSTLNRVIGAEARPSEILGRLRADGTVYIINQNGILFGENSQVDVGSLIASGLDIDDQLYMQSSFIDAINNDQAAFAGIDNGQEIIIQNGAHLRTEDGGRILIFAPKIVNEGKIETPDGQAILAAAKDRVYITAVKDTSIRGGLLVEVETGGEVTNAALGEVIAERGNITLLGMAVNQQGRLTATTSINNNGSIRLIARDNVTLRDGNAISEGELRLLGLRDDLTLFDGLDAIDSGNKIAVASNTGKVVIGKDSKTEVLPDFTDESTATDLAESNPSTIDIVGQQIHVQENAKIRATSGEVNISATQSSNQPFLSSNDSYVYLDENSIIDVSGIDDVSLAMERNSLQVELRDSDALRDSPLQRGGVLSGETVSVDLRNGTEIADIQGALNQVQKGIGERMTSGGTVNVFSEGDVVQGEGSLVDVSGGSVKYEDGFIQSTQLISEGRIYDISEADPNRIYDGILGQDSKFHEKWGVTETFDSNNLESRGAFVEGFVEGKEAGSFNLQATSAWLQDDGVNAEQVVGPYQRDASQVRANAGSIYIDLAHYANAAQNIRFMSSEDIVNSLEASMLEVPDANGQRNIFTGDALISADFIKNSGALYTEFKTNGAISIQRAINAPAGGSIAMQASTIDVTADITAQGGNISLQTNVTPSVNNASIHIANGVNINTQGAWVNDNPLINQERPDNPLFIDGGNVEIIAEGDISFEAGASINASGGAQLTADAEIDSGRGGDITLSAVNTDEDARLILEGELSSYGVETGGDLTLSANQFVITDDDAIVSTPESVVLNSDFFQQGGFNAYNLNALVNGIEIQQGTQINAQANRYIIGDKPSVFEDLSRGNTFSLAGESISLSEDAKEILSANNVSLDDLQQIKDDINSQSLSFDDSLQAIETQLEGRGINVDDESIRNLIVQVLNLDSNDLAFIASKPNLNDFALIGRTDDYQDNAVDISFNSFMQVPTSLGADSSIIMQTGSAITTGVGGVVSFTSDRNIFIDGTIQANAGEINLALKSPSNGTFDLGFQRDQSLWLGENSQLINRAAILQKPGDTSIGSQVLRDAVVKDAGTISLVAERGYIVAKEGSQIDISGAHTSVDRLSLNGSDNSVSVTAVDVAGSAGTLRIDGQESVFMEGNILANAADVDGASGGSLDITFGIDGNRISKDENDSLLAVGRPGFIFSDRFVEIENGTSSVFTSGLNYSDDVSDSLNGRFVVNADQVQNAGFDSLSITTRDSVFTGLPSAFGSVVFNNTALNLSSRINLNTRSIVANGNVDLAASYISAGSNTVIDSVVRAPTSGSGVLNIDSDLVDLSGSLSIANSSNVNINSRGDVRLVGVIDNNDKLSGNFQVADDLQITAKQIYPTTFSDYEIEAGNSVVINGIGEHNPVQSAVGQLTIKAPSIEQLGVVKAPNGNISLEASNSLTLGSQSITSVSAEGQNVFFGQTQLNASDWLYTVNDKPVLFDNSDSRFDQLPEKGIVFDAPDIDLEDGASVDLSGNGDLLAYEFIPGAGGSNDVLAVDNVAGSFAILPGLNSDYAPIDSSIPLSSDYQVGDNIVFADAAVGLPAGEYTILPARYALLPGAYLVTPTDTGRDAVPGSVIQQLNGASLIAGQHTIANTEVRDSLWSNFIVEPGSVANTRSEYLLSSANTFFAEQATANNITTPFLPQDAGSLVLRAANSLELGAEIISDNNGRGARLDIQSDRLAVVNSRGVSGAGVVELDVDQLNQLNVESLLLGGVRSRSENGTNITVGADEVVIQNDVNLQAPEIMLAANEEVILNSGSQVTGSGTISDVKDNYQFIGKNNIDDGAFLRASASQQAIFNRPNETTSPARGRITIAEDAVVAADSSINIDASNEIDLAGTINLQNGSLQLGAPRISLGETESVVGISGLVLSSSNLDTLNVDQLVLNSRSTVDFYGNFDLSFESLELQAASIRGINNTADNASLTASDQIILSNVNGIISSDTSSDSGSLNLNANNIVIGKGDLAISGFDNVSLSATDRLLGKDTGKLNTSANISISTGLITGDTSADTSIISQGNISLANNGTGNTNDIDSIGAALTLEAQTINSDVDIILPSGRVSMLANGGNASDHLVLGSNTVIDVSGRTLDFSDVSVTTDAGQINLSSLNGDVRLQTGSMLDLSARAGEANAGRLNIAATQGTIFTQGSILASSENGAGGEFSLDVNTLSDFSLLNNLLRTAGFDESIDIRQRSGNISIQTTDAIIAESIQLSADSGDIIVSGELNASGDSGGAIRLNAGNNLELSSTAQLLALAKLTDGQGGSVFLGSKNGNLNLVSGSLIDVSSGTDSSEGGDLTLRVARNATNDGLMLNQAATQVVGAAQVNLHAYRQYNRTTVPGTSDSVFAEAANFMSNSTSILTSLGSLSSNNNFYLSPEIHIHSNGNLILNSELDLFNTRYADNVGILSLSAENNLLINSSLSDGFRNQQLTPADEAFQPGSQDFPSIDSVLQSGNSWSYNLIAGADNTSADLLDARQGQGDITLAANTKIRTGTGDINLVAGNDLNLTNQTSVIYTAGENTVPSDAIAPELLDFFLIPGQAAYPTNGGDLNIHVGGSIEASDSNQLFTHWLQRAGGYEFTNADRSIAQLFPGSTLPEVAPTTWALVFEDFEQGIGALGGGDISIVAGENINNLSVSIPTTGKPTLANNGLPEVLGGGNLQVYAGKDINSGRFLLGKGGADISAGGNISNSNDSDLGLVLALGDAQANVFANNDIDLSSVSNPTLIAMSRLQNDSIVRNLDVRNRQSYFSTYAENSEISLGSLTGNLTFKDSKNDFENEISNIEFSPFGRDASTSLYIYPAVLSANALNGNINFENSLLLSPSSQGSMQILAGGDISSSRETGALTLSMSGVDPAEMPSVENPITNILDFTGANGLLQLDVRIETDINRAYNAFFAENPARTDDTQASYVIANRDIITEGDPFYILSSESTRVIAGRDIINSSVIIQNNLANDISLVQAGRDIRYPSARDIGGSLDNNLNRIDILGPGRLDVIAGRNIDLGSSVGIRSGGNTVSRGLPEEGADITLISGVESSLSYDAFIQQYLEEDNRFNQQLFDFVSSDEFAGELNTYVSAVTGESYISRQAAINALNNLSTGQQQAVTLSAFKGAGQNAQREMILNIYFSELQLAGTQDVRKEIDDPEQDGFVRGFNAIDTLFPENEINAGSINVELSTVRSFKGGDINFIAPGGSVDAGLPVIPDFGTGTGVKTSEDLGMIVSGVGNINGMADDDISVNLSRVFTLGGGDIVLWSTEGDIDAGRGAKSSLSVPPPQIDFNPDNGDVIEETPPAVAGSGIQCVSPAGAGTCSIFLFAPKGVVDAGEAGIGASGDLLIAATEVLNADNIDVGGISVGVPVTAGISSDIAGASSLGSSAADSALDSVDSNLSDNNSDAVTFLTVEVIGVGDFD